MSNRIYDVAVIGAGPAGSLAAALAAKSGFSTVIVEQKYFPRLKICGGFISSRCLNLFPADLGLPAVDLAPVHSITVTNSRQCYDYYSEKKLGLLIKRSHFDHFLAGYACKSGAVLNEGFSLGRLLHEPGGKPGRNIYLLYASKGSSAPVRARYVIGADGAFGRCGLLSGLRKNSTNPGGWALSAIKDTQPAAVKPGTLAFYPLPLSGGMGWSFTGQGWVNQGVGGLASRKRLLKVYRNLFPEKKESPEPLNWPLPFSGPLKKAASDNLMLVGDAAGLVEPYSGEGLYNCIKSSILAITALNEAEKKGHAAGPLYQHFFNFHFRQRFAFTLAGAALLHIRSILAPSTLPPVIAALIENRLWYNHGLSNPPCR